MSLIRSLLEVRRRAAAIRRRTETTPAHGTAHAISAKGVAHPGAMIAALKLSAQIATGA